MTASILFAVMAIVLVASGALARPEARGRILTALLPSLTAMLVAGLLFALIPGEKTPERAAAMAIPTAALFAVGAVGAFVALAWAVHGSDDAKTRDEQMRQSQHSAAWAPHVIWMVAATEFYLTVVNAENHMCRPWFGAPAVGRGWPAVAIGLGAAMLVSVVILLFRAIGRAYGGSWAVPSWLLYVGVLVMFVAYNLAALKPGSAWEVAIPDPSDSERRVKVLDRPPSELDWIIGLAVAYVLLSGWLLLWALPRCGRIGRRGRQGDTPRPGEATGEAQAAMLPPAPRRRSPNVSAQWSHAPPES